MTPHAIGFLGAGQMATALANGWIANDMLDLARSIAADPHHAAREKFATATGVKAVESNVEVIEACHVIILAVKPQTISGVLAGICSHLKPHHLLISIAAGVTLSHLTELLGASTRIVRVMPNTPALVGASATGYSPGSATKPDDVELVGRLFNSVGTAITVPEHLLDAVTGLSGSGPAYVFVFIEALADAGVRAGLSRDVALKLAAQTVFGSAKMVLQTGTHPAVLKDAVASPAGTTIAGLHALEQAGFRAAVMDAVNAATVRATELANTN